MTYGMSEKLGPISFDDSGHSLFIGRDFGTTKSYSEKTAALIDEEVRRLFDEAQVRCESLLNDHSGQLVSVAEYLLQNESMEGADFARFCSTGELPVKEPKAAAEPVPEAAEETPAEQPEEPTAEI